MYQELDNLWSLYLFWLIQKTDIQRAREVRSVKGLLIDVFGKIASTFINLIF
jgi:hypothetical protein